MADYYVSAENGNDGNTGLSEAQAWATIDKAASDVLAGNDVHIAPGIYRETVVADNAGALGNPIRFIGDPECLHFANESPGRVRITDTNASEEVQDDPELISSKQDYVEWHNLHLDGADQAIDFNSYTGRIVYDSVIAGIDGVINAGAAVRCYVTGRANIMQDCNAEMVVAICGGTVFRWGTQKNCLGIGGGQGYIYDSIARSDNCIAIGGRMGWRNCGANTIYNCWAFSCTYSDDYCAAGAATDCYSLRCNTSNQFTPTSRQICFNLAALAGLMPWLVTSVPGGLIRQGSNAGPGFDATDVDISGHRLRLKGADLDIGPWSISEPTDTPYAAAAPGLLDWGTFQTTAPSVRIEAEGDYALRFPAEAGVTFTVTCQVKHVGIVGDKPQLVLRGDGIAEQIDTAVGGDDTWEELSVTATPMVDEVLTLVLRARNSAGVCYFSDVTPL